jgi:hypothetical protein
MMKGATAAPEIPFKKRLLDIEPDALFIAFLLNSPRDCPDRSAGAEQGTISIFQPAAAMMFSRDGTAITSKDSVIEPNLPSLPD